MARKFRSALSQYYEYSSAIVTVAPFSMSCWFNADATNTDQTLICAGSSGGTYYYALGKNVSGNIYIETAGGASATTSTAFTARKWHHALATFPAASTGAIYLNGGGKATFGGGATQSSIDNFSVGVLDVGSLFGKFDGMIDRVAIWRGLALSDFDAARLASGEHARRVRPDSLIAYWDFSENKDVWCEPDLIGKFHLTRFGGATVMQGQPFVQFPQRGRKPTWFLHVAAAAADNYFVTRVNIPNPRVGPMALRNKWKPGYKFGGKVGGNRRRRVITSKS